MNHEKLLNVLIKQGFSFSGMRESDAEMHKEFVKKHWPNSPLKGDLAYNKWKFGENQYGDISIGIVKFNDKIVGQGGAIPYKIVLHGKVYDCVWGCNFMIDEEYKSVGLGAAIDIYGMKYSKLIVGANPTEEAGKYKKKLGWLSLDGPTSLYYPIKINDLIKIKKSKGAIIKLIDFASFFANPLWKRFNLLKLAFHKARNWVYTDLDHIIGRIAVRRAQLKIPHVLHDRAFFDWRLNPPEYAKREVKFLITRKGKSYAVYTVSGNRVTVLEQYFDTQKDFKSFLKFILREESGRKIGLIKAYANSDRELQMFKSSFFIPMRTIKKFIVYSQDNLFEGIDKFHVDLYDGDGLLA